MARQLGSGYVLDDLIGRGATGEVWRGRRIADDSAIAVKLLRPELADDPELVARFVQERSLLISLSNDHLVRVHDLVVEGGSLAIVMDLVGGHDLRHVLRARRFVPEEALDTATQILDGLAAVHAAGIVHRDLKPENILIEQLDDGPTRVLITDFGVARLAHGPSLTKITGLIGTPVYMAPELSERGSPSAAADLYSAGVVLYEMLAGRPPFEAEHPIAVMRAHLEEDPMPIPGLPPQIWAIVASLLAKDPHSRPDSAADAARQLRAVRAAAAGLPALVAPASAAPVDPYATTLPDAGATYVGGRRSNPPRDDAGHDTARVDSVVEAPKHRRRSRRLIVAAAVVCAIVLIGGVAFGAIGREEKPKVVAGGSTTTAADKTTTSAKRSTSTTVKKKKTTTTTLGGAGGAGGGAIAGGSIGGVSGGGTLPGGSGGPDVGPVATSPSGGSPGAGPTTPPLPTVPGVVGLTLESAASRLKAAGYNNLPYVYGCFGSTNHNRVVQQTPSGGAKAANSQAIDLKLEANNCAIVPNVVGKTLAGASSTLTAAGFNNLPYVYQCLGSPNVGAVVSQSPTGGTDIVTSNPVSLRLQANNC